MKISMDRIIAFHIQMSCVYQNNHYLYNLSQFKFSSVLLKSSKLFKESSIFQTCRRHGEEKKSKKKNGKYCKLNYAIIFFAFLKEKEMAIKNSTKRKKKIFVKEWKIFWNLIILHEKSSCLRCKILLGSYLVATKEIFLWLKIDLFFEFWLRVDFWMKFYVVEMEAFSFGLKASEYIL